MSTPDSADDGHLPADTQPDHSAPSDSVPHDTGWLRHAAEAVSSAIAYLIIRAGLQLDSWCTSRRRPQDGRR